MNKIPDLHKEVRKNNYRDDEVKNLFEAIVSREYPTVTRDILIGVLVCTFSIAIKNGKSRRKAFLISIDNLENILNKL